jgi:carbonic anhydrase
VECSEPTSDAPGSAFSGQSPGWRRFTHVNRFRVAEDYRPPILRGATDPPEDAIAYLESVPIEKFLGGISRFQRDVYPKHQDLFEKLATGQRPEALFITCADSRIDPCLLTQTKPGELFICRVIGNVVPPYPDAVGGVSATIEYAVGVLRVPEVIVCGHTDCGVMRGALHPEALEAYPNVTAWLRYAQVEHREAAPSPEFLLALTEDNVVAQLKNLRSHPTVMARLEQGDLALHGWVYHIGPGTVTAYDEASQNFATTAPM